MLSNLFGTEDRVAAAIGRDSREALTELGRLLAALRAPQPPRSVGEAWRALPLLKEILNMAPKTVRSAPCQEVVVEGADVDLADWPIQTCWPDDVAPLITWGLTTTRGPLARAAEPRHLPPAGHRPQQDHHALARAPRRRNRLPGVLRRSIPASGSRSP